MRSRSMLLRLALVAGLALACQPRSTTDQPNPTMPTEAPAYKLLEITVGWPIMEAQTRGYHVVQMWDGYQRSYVVLFERDDLHPRAESR